ncbi:hypothetical protein G6F56_005129 [Rhizopus delemar]|nr:hypothetical protein G6F56_005129 [Rhizopus delemar]
MNSTVTGAADNKNQDNTFQAENMDVDAEGESRNDSPAAEAISTKAPRLGVLASKYADPIIRVEKDIECHQFDLENCYYRMDKAKSEGDKDGYDASLRKIDEIQENMERLKLMLENLRFSTKNKKATISISAKDLPAFQLVGKKRHDPTKPAFETPFAFLNKLEKLLINANMNIDQDWHSWLNLTISDDDQFWFNNNLQPQMSWKEARKIFEKRFTCLARRLEKAKQAYNIRMEKGESLSDFCNRTLNTMNEGQVEDCEGMALCFLGALPKEIGNAISTTWYARHDDNELPQSVKEIMDITDSVTIAERAHINNDEQKEHKNKTCRYCGNPWKYKHHCKEYLIAHGKKEQKKMRTIYKNKSNKNNVRSLTKGMSELDFYSQNTGKRLRVIQKDNWADQSSILTPIYIQNDKLLALIDTGAECSVISLNYCLKNKISYVMSSTHSSLNAAGNNSVRIYGITENLNINYNGINTKHSFHVINMDEELSLYLGMDILPKLGIGLTGVAHMWDNEKPNIYDDHIDDDQPPNESPSGNEAERKRFFKYIIPLIKENEAIDKSSFCTMPESIVELPTPDANRTFVRQYPIAYSLQPAVDEAVQTWLKDGTITFAPVNTSWNSPLTLAPKKDEFGKITGKRPCLDPRHINKFLPDDKFPLPLIRDIFHELRNSKIFTTLDLKSAFHRFKIAEKDQHKTTFTHNGLQYMFRGCPFGLKPLSSKFQRTMALLYKDLPFVHNFVDDIVIHSENLEDHKEHVARAVKRLTNQTKVSH